MFLGVVSGSIHGHVQGVHGHFRPDNKRVAVLPTQLLMDIRTILGQHGMTQITSEELLRELCNDSAKPWSTFNNGKPLTSNKMAVLLRPYNIKPKAMRFPSGSKRGYMTEQFTDAFERYLP